MLDNDRIKAAAEKAARVAYTVLGLDCPYSVAFINDPDISEDARLDTQKNEVQLNLAHGFLFWYPLNKRGLNRGEIKQQQVLRKRNAMNPCYENEAKAILENAKIVNSAGGIDCPILMFVSDGKQISSGWINYEREFAARMHAKTVYLNCGHYIHYYESERISREIKAFVNQIMEL